MLHFLEGIAGDGAVGSAQLQGAVSEHAVYGGLELCAAGQLKGVFLAVVAIKHFEELLVQFLARLGCELGEALDLIAHLVHHLFNVILLAGELCQRHGVGGISL